jgi:hypothetical protein
VIETCKLYEKQIADMSSPPNFISETWCSTHNGHYRTSLKCAKAEISRLRARVQQLEAGISAIFDKRKGAYGTALIDRGELELCVDLENLRKLLPASNACEGT